MEIKQLKMKGHQVTSIFTGGFYYFHSSFYGLIAIAKRVETDGELWEKTKFVIRVGNKQTVGSCLGYTAPVAFVKRFIRLQERQYAEDKKVEFEVVQEDLNNSYLEITEKRYRDYGNS